MVGVGAEGVLLPSFRIIAECVFVCVCVCAHYFWMIGAFHFDVGLHNISDDPHTASVYNKHTSYTGSTVERLSTLLETKGSKRVFLEGLIFDA